MSATSGSAEPQLGTYPATHSNHTAEPRLSVPQMNLPAAGVPKRWHSRGYLPHVDGSGLIQSITFRLADSLPQAALRAIEEELKGFTPQRAHAERRRKMEAWLDSGAGCCALAHPELGRVMQETLRKWEGDRYRLLAWCVMPNHVHVLLETKAALPRIVQSWKSFTGRWALRMNAELGLGIPGRALWMREYWDRFIRDETHFAMTRSYIERNPVTAHLCKEPQDWPWSSASWERRAPARHQP